MNAEMHVNERGRWVDDACSPDDRSFAMFTHLSLLAHMVVPFVAVIIPILMWHNKKDSSPYVADHGREAVNFQLSLMLYSIILPTIAIPVGLLLFLVGVAITVPLAAIFPYVLGLIGMIHAAMAANRGEMYRYPMTIRFLDG